MVAVIEEIQTELRRLLSTEVPDIAKGVVQAPGAGWVKAVYFDPITGSRIIFKEPPTIVAVAEVRAGKPPTVTAPTISIPTVEMPTAPTLSIPTMSLPSAPSINVPLVAIPETPTIEIPEVTIPFLNESFPAFIATVDWAKPWAESLNKLREALYAVQGRANDVIWAINQGLKKAREAAIAIRDSLFDFRDKVQTAINDYKDKIQDAVNSGFSDARTKTQEALNAYRDKIQTNINAGLADFRTKTQLALKNQRDSIQNAVNTGLSQVIPALYAQLGIPTDQLISTVQLRNVTADSFFFYAPSAGYKLHYVAFGRKV